MKRDVQSQINGSARTQGLQAQIVNNTGMYVRDDTPNAEARYRARFTFDPNSISIGYSGMHDIFVGRSGTIDVFRVQVTRLYGSYQLRTQARFDSATYTTTAWLPISDAAHLIEIDWQAATSSGANNGYLTLWIDGVPQSTLANLDNDTRRVDEVRLGPSNGIDTYTRGTEYFDDFESRRSTYIGPVLPSNAASVIRKSYYRAGSQLIAMRVEGEPIAGNNGLFFLHSDHLGSASLTTNASGTAIARQLYDAWGNIRVDASTGSMPTDIGYTGQRLDASTGGLMFYGARFYSPGIMRFISADTMVPSPSDPQQLNRYAYGLNNPVKYQDPSGHCAVEGDDDKCSPPSPTPSMLPSGQYLYTQQYGWFDRNHIGAANPKSVIDQVRYGILNGGGEVVVRDGTMGGFKFRSTYQVVGKEGATEEYINGVALGIYTDFEVRFEFWEGLITFPLPVTQYTTMYAIEDLPSDYLGFAMAAKGLTAEQAFAYLEPDSSKVTGTNAEPPRSWDSSEKNYWISPKVNGVNVPWPQELAITPIGLGDGINAWGFVGSWGSGLFGIRAEN